MKVHFCDVGLEQVEPRPAHPYLYVSLLLPGRIDRLGKQKCGIGSRSRRELLYASCVHFREVQIALLVDAQPVYTPEVAICTSRKWTQDAYRSSRREREPIPHFCLPGRIDRLGKQKCGIGSRSRRELLYASCVHFREVQIALLVDAQPMYTPEVAGTGTHAAPGVKQMALQVVLDHFVGGAIKGPEGVSGSDVEQVKTGRRSVNLPFVEILAVFIEDLDAVIVPIVHENVAGLLVNGDTMHVAEIAGTSVERFVIASSARAAFNAPLHEEFSVLVKLGDARSRVAIGDEESAIREPVDIRRTIEMIGVFAGNFRRSDRLQQLAAVMRESVYGVHVVVHDPHVLFRIVGADVDGVRAAEDFVPLLPSLEDVSVAVVYDEAVLPLRVLVQFAEGWPFDSELGGLPFPGSQPFPGVLIRSPVPGSEATVASRQKPAT